MHLFILSAGCGTTGWVAELCPAHGSLEQAERRFSFSSVSVFFFFFLFIQSKLGTDLKDWRPFRSASRDEVYPFSSTSSGVSLAIDSVVVGSERGRVGDRLVKYTARSRGHLQ